MKIIAIACNDRFFTIGKTRRKIITSNGCNEPCKNRFYCPKRNWLMLEKCPFLNLNECNNFVKMCGKI
ncbi:MAG TPA: hypothetical protein DDW90_08215 [Cyanobacteria bacterium UBA9971]|nr:hypothetical protein [Cyanobacteria bacterium UBA9971]HCR36136.1 hypothetical protein [Candidatus Woesebacteria bacterium]